MDIFSHRQHVLTRFENVNVWKPTIVAVGAPNQNNTRLIKPSTIISNSDRHETVPVLNDAGIEPT